MDAEFYFNRGLEKTRNKDFFGAIDDYTTAIKLSSGSTKRTISNDLGNGATEHVDVIETSEGNVNMYYNRACVHLDLGNYEAGIYDLTKVIQYSPEDGEAYFKRAIANYCMKNDDQKDKDLSMANRLNPAFNQELFSSIFNI